MASWMLSNDTFGSKRALGRPSAIVVRRRFVWIGGLPVHGLGLLCRVYRLSPAPARKGSAVCDPRQTAIRRIDVNGLESASTSADASVIGIGVQADECRIGSPELTFHGRAQVGPCELVCLGWS